MAFPSSAAGLMPQLLAKKLHAEDKLLPAFQDARPNKSPPHKYVSMRVLETGTQTTSFRNQSYDALPAAPRLEFIQPMSGFDYDIERLRPAAFQMPQTQQQIMRNQESFVLNNGSAMNRRVMQLRQHPHSQIRATPPIQIGRQTVQDAPQVQSNQTSSWNSLSTSSSDEGHLVQGPEPSRAQSTGNSYDMAQFRSHLTSAHDSDQAASLSARRPPLDFNHASPIPECSFPAPTSFIYASLPGGRVVRLPHRSINQRCSGFAEQKTALPPVSSHIQATESEEVDSSDDDWDSAFDESGESDESDQSHENLEVDNNSDGSSEEDGETKQEYRNRLIHNLKQMMFVSGETAEPSTETTWMIEEIVREQVVEMLKEATTLANRRGSKSIAIVDLIFQIRHNPAKVSRLKTFLSWKDVRKNVKDSDDKAGGADADALDLEDGALPGANPAAPQKTSANKKAKLILPWEVQSFYNETVPEREDEEDEEEEEQNEATLARLASADERTKNMTKDEYVYWSDCRQASFTFRKGKRFREWAGFGTIIDSKPNDDVVDILGFLTFEIVQTLTEEALRVKAAEDLANKKANGLRGDNEASKKRKREGCTLFEMPEEGRTPVEPKHVREAFRRLQIVPTKYKFMRQGYAGVRTPLRMI